MLVHLPPISDIAVRLKEVDSMEDEKLCGAMTRLPEGVYFELRRMALERRKSFAVFARQILEEYLKASGKGGSDKKAA